MEDGRQERAEKTGWKLRSRNQDDEAKASRTKARRATHSPATTHNTPRRPSALRFPTRTRLTRLQ